MAGSQFTDLVPFAKVGRPHGVHGEIRVFAYSEPWPDTDEVVWRREREERRLSISSVRGAGEYLIVGLAAVRGRQQAAQLTGGELCLSPEQLPDLDGGEFYLFELVGAKAVDAQGSEFGVIEALHDNSGQPLAMIRQDAKKVAVPLVGPTILRWDRQHRRLYLDPPLGLFSEPKPAEEQAD